VLLLLWAAVIVCGRAELHAVGVLRIGVPEKAPAAFDPHLSAGTDALMAEMVFNALLRYQPGNSAVIEPDLAESLPKARTEGGRQVWTFTLKRGVMFQPGAKDSTYEMKSDDVVYSLQRAADPLRSIYAYRYAGMSFKAAGPYTVQVALDKPMSTTLFLPIFADRAGGAIVSRKAAEGSNADEFRRRPIGTGPFAFRGASASGVIAFEAHKAYFRGAPLLDGVDAVYLPDLYACEQAFKRDELHMLCGERSSRWADKAALWPKTRVDVYGPAESLYLAFNTLSGPLSDRRVRQAIAHALTRRGFTDLFGASVADSIYAHVPSDITGAVSEKEIRALGLEYGTSLVLAQQLLRQALAADERSIRIECAPWEGERPLYEVLRRQLERVGITVVLGDQDATPGHGARPGNQALAFRWALPAAADELLMGLLAQPGAAATAPDDGTVSGYRKLDMHLEAARRETGLRKQQEIWRHVQFKLLQDMVLYPICTIKYVVARKASVDYGYTLSTCRMPVPPITEKTRILE
jgi:peptide/nickel transport system substrate-binding protein